MDQELLKLIGGGGALSGIVFFVVKYGAKYIIAALERLYSDMKEQHKEQLDESKKREDRLLAYLEQKNATDLKVSQTLDSIGARISNIECHLGKGE